MKYIYKVNGVVEDVHENNITTNEPLKHSDSSALHNIGFRLLCALPGITLGGGGAYVARENEAGLLFCFLTIMGTIIFAISMKTENDYGADNALTITVSAACVSAFIVSGFRILASM